MLKFSFIFIFTSLISISPETTAMVSPIVAPTFAQGYQDGLREGTRLALMPDHSTYNALWKSYRDYPGNFPNHTQNHPYFRGKYLGIVDGWLANFDPCPGCGGPTPGNCYDSNGTQIPCTGLINQN